MRTKKISERPFDPSRSESFSAPSSLPRSAPEALPLLSPLYAMSPSPPRPFMSSSPARRLVSRLWLMVLGPPLPLPDPFRQATSPRPWLRLWSPRYTISPALHWAGVLRLPFDFQTLNTLNTFTLTTLRRLRVGKDQDRGRAPFPSDPTATTQQACEMYQLYNHPGKSFSSPFLASFFWAN